jgi:hypothetical protein
MEVEDSHKKLLEDELTLVEVAKLALSVYDATESCPGSGG